MSPERFRIKIPDERWFEENIDCENACPVNTDAPAYIAAIIGAGPSGLAAANDLPRMGYRVVVYECLDVKGRMLNAGIPRKKAERERPEIVREMPQPPHPQRDLHRMSTKGLTPDPKVTIYLHSRHLLPSLIHSG